MRWKILTAMTLLACLLLTVGFPPLCGAEDYVAKKGVVLYRVDLQNLAQQILKLDPTDKDQRDFLDRLFQMKFTEAERMFQVCGEEKEVKRQVAELYLLKAIEADTMGNWIQSYFALQNAEAWNKGALTQSLQIGENRYDMAAFSQELENKAQRWGNKVRFVIKPFPPGQIFRPDKVVLARSEEKETEPATEESLRRPPRRSDRGGPGGRPDAIEEPVEKMEISQRDESFLLDRFSKALYAYYYDPVDKNAQFDVFLPHGEYYLYEKDFTVHPVEFEVSDRSTQVVVQPARWFRLTVSEEVHPSDVRLSFHGTEWTDFEHVPFGRYRVCVKNHQFTSPALRMTFAPKAETSSGQDPSAATEEAVVVEDRGVYKLALRERTGNEKLRYKLFGY